MSRDAKSEDLLYMFGSVARLKDCITAAEELFTPKNTSFPELIIFAPAFFALTQRLLTSETFISLSRILDGRTDVLALDQLIHRHIKLESKNIFLLRANTIKKRSAEIIKQRHKAIAHLDYEFAAGKGEFRPIEIGEIKEITTEIEQLLNDIQANLFPGVNYAKVRGQLSAQNIQEMLRKIKSANDIHPPYHA